jgi:hypothetical protein
MHRQIFFLLGLVILLNGNAYPQRFDGGGSARHIALGGGPINPYLRDIMRVHTNPAQLASDSNFIWSDLGYLATDAANGGSRYQFLAVGIDVSERSSVGLILNKRESPLYTVDNATPALDPIDEMNGYVGSVLGFGSGQFARPLSPLEVVGSLHDSQYDVGGSITYGGWTNERSIGGDLSQSIRTWRFKLGFFAPHISNAIAVDAAVLLGLNSMEATYTAAGQMNSLSMDGGSELGLDVRTEYAVNGRWMLVPRIRWYTFSWGMSQVKSRLTLLPDPVSEYSHDEYEIGIGENIRLENVLIVGGLSYQRTVLVSNYKNAGASSKTTTTIDDLPKINLGAEIRLASWVVARIGYFDRLATTETVIETISGKTTTTVTSELPWYGDPNGLSAAQQRVTIGFGIEIERLMFDGTIGEGYFLNGPWPLSGTAQQMFGVVSVSFQF